MARRGRDNDGKYVRLTGLWPSKKNDALWTGKIRNQDLFKVLDKLDEADKHGKDIVVFLWENTEKDGPKDPEFTAQISVSEDQERGRGRRSSRGRDRDEEEEEEQVEEVEDEEPEEKEERPSRRSKSSTKSASKSRSRSSRPSKNDKNDW